MDRVGKQGEERGRRDGKEGAMDVEAMVMFCDGSVDNATVASAVPLRRRHVDETSVGV